MLGSSHHNHVTSPLSAPARDILDTEDESVVMLPQSASLIEMFQVGTCGTLELDQIYILGRSMKTLLKKYSSLTGLPFFYF